MRRALTEWQVTQQRLQLLLEQGGFTNVVISVGADLPDVYRRQEHTFLATVDYTPTRITLLRTALTQVAQLLLDDPLGDILHLAFGAALPNARYAIAFTAVPPTVQPIATASPADVASIVAAATKQAVPNTRKLVITMLNIEQAEAAVRAHLESTPDALMHYDETIGDVEWSTENGETNELTVYTHGPEHHFSGEYIVQLADDLTVISVYTVNDECAACISEQLDDERAARGY